MAATLLEKCFLTDSESLASVATFVSVHDEGTDRRIVGVEASLGVSDGESAVLLDFSEFLDPTQDAGQFQATMDAHAASLDVLIERATTLRNELQAATRRAVSLMAPLA